MKRAIVYALFAGFLSACAGAPKTGTDVSAQATAPPTRTSVEVNALEPLEEALPAMAGVWESNGYGYVADLTGPEPRFFHVTGDYCLSFGDDETTPFDAVDRAGLSEDGRRLYVGASPEPHVYEFDRLAARPDLCLTPPGADRVAAFETFAAYMAAHYAFFDVHDLDWAVVTTEARTRLGSVASDADLFALLSDMIAPIRDGHLELIAKIDGEVRSFDPGEAPTYQAAILAGAARGLSPREAKRGFNQVTWLEGVDRLFLPGTGVSTGNGWIKYGLVANDVGYFGTYTSGGYAARDFSDPLGDLAVLEAALDDALAQFALVGVRAVIVDASMNHGGHDFISRAIAARFAQTSLFAYAKFARDASDPYRTDVYLTPAEGVQFTGQVYFLTSDITVSAAEILTLSMRALPNVVHVGGRTRGAFSDILEKPLSNGWALTLSNEVYVDNQGCVWEGRGIPPDIEQAVFTVDDPAGAHAAAVRALIEMAQSAPLPATINRPSRRACRSPYDPQQSSLLPPIAQGASR
jgi:carboxyl-terminal processing protease